MSYISDRSDESEGLVGVASDYLFFGGLSLLVFILLEVFSESLNFSALVVLMMVLANFVNHPHFAHSYQLFYRSWGTVLKLGSVGVRWRWWFAGVGFPFLSLLYFYIGWQQYRDGNALLLALSVNLMGLLVGWHYVKQGFGICMTDAATKRCYWSAPTRQALLWNAYVCWACTWLIVNGSSAGSMLWGVAGIDVNIPSWLILIACLVVVFAAAWVGVLVSRDIRSWRGRGLTLRQQPLAGLLAYLVSIYAWSIFGVLKPAFLLVIPFFHSLQYMAVVWRYNRGRLAVVGEVNTITRRLGFYGYGVLLGGAAFWLLPALLEWHVNGVVPSGLYSAAPFLFMAWVFINIHHYVIDNSLWRKDNPLVNQYLFNSAARF